MKIILLRPKLNVIPGVGMGPLKLGMSQKDVIKIMGFPSFNDRCPRFIYDEELKKMVPSGYSVLDNEFTTGEYLLGFRHSALFVGLRDDKVVFIEDRGSRRPVLKGIRLNKRLYTHVLKDLEKVGCKDFLICAEGLIDKTGSVCLWSSSMVPPEDVKELTVWPWNTQEDGVINAVSVAYPGYHEIS